MNKNGCNSIGSQDEKIFECWPLNWNDDLQKPLIDIMPQPKIRNLFWAVKFEFQVVTKFIWLFWIAEILRKLGNLIFLFQIQECNFKNIIIRFKLNLALSFISIFGRGLNCHLFKKIDVLLPPYQQNITRNYTPLNSHPLK